jgi:hypothetical protein
VPPQSSDEELLHAAVRRTVLEGAGDRPDAVAVARSTVATWRQLDARLAPVIGKRGVEVLFVRATHLSSRSFPWLGGNRDAVGNPLETLRGRLESREGPVAADAACTVLVTFAALLATLIGDSLSKRLLAPVLTPASNEERPT